MPRKRLKGTRFTPSPSKVVLLLSQFILLETGLLAIWLVKTTFKLLTKKLTVSLALFIIGCTLIYVAFNLMGLYHLRSPESLAVNDKPLTTEFYDRHGALLYRLYEGRNRTLVKLDQLPLHLIQATIAIEDKNFYSHPGFDITAITRALYHNVVNHTQEGASTITQQLIKNTLLTPEKTISRKIKELILAFWTEQLYTKAQILQMYFNEVGYGGPAWGVEAASRVYFGKHSSQLNLAESAFLAGLPASPTQFSPYGARPELAKSRQIQVLEKMVKQGYISESEKNGAISQPLNLQPQTNNILAPHFVFYVKDLLSQKYGPRIVAQGGLKIYTTLDLNLQQEIEKIVSEEVNSLASLNVTNGAALVTDAKTGQILAMVGSRDYHYGGFGNYNVTLSLRQPGSSIKPITYAAALKMGLSPGNTILDTPAVFKDRAGNVYKPVNYDGHFHGPVSIRQALGSSLNLPAVKLLNTIGVDSMIATATDLGITTFNDPKRFGLSLTLGGGEVKMTEMMGVYGAFADSGKLHKSAAVLKVVDPSGKVLEEFKDEPKQAVSKEIAYMITNILSDNNARILAFGPNSLLNIDPNVAVKTGTSDNKRDNLTFGFSRDFVVGVWVGNNDNSPMNPTLASGITGAAPIWNKITKQLLTQFPSQSFTRPERVINTLVDGRKDLAIDGNRPNSLLRIGQTN